MKTVIRCHDGLGAIFRLRHASYPDSLQPIKQVSRLSNGHGFGTRVDEAMQGRVMFKPLPLGVEMIGQGTYLADAGDIVQLERLREKSRRLQGVRPRCPDLPLCQTAETSEIHQIYLRTILVLGGDGHLA